MRSRTWKEQYEEQPLLGHPNKLHIYPFLFLDEIPSHGSVLRASPFGVLESVLPTYLSRSSEATLLTFTMHNTLKKQDSIHRERTMSGLSVDRCLIWKLLCSFKATRVTCCCEWRSGVVSMCCFHLLIRLTLLQCLVALASSFTSSDFVAYPSSSFPSTSAHPDK